MCSQLVLYQCMCPKPTLWDGCTGERKDSLTIDEQIVLISLSSFSQQHWQSWQPPLTQVEGLPHSNLNVPPFNACDLIFQKKQFPCS